MIGFTGLRAIYATVLAIGLTGCGIAYTSPQISGEDDNVVVVPLTGQTVQQANQSVYTPKSLPAAFFQNAGSVQGMARSAAAPPAPSISEQQRPAALTLRLPPPVDAGPYRIGVSDVLLLATKSSGSAVEELSGLLAAQNRRQGYTVQDDGAIAVPDVGRVRLEGLTLEEAEAQLFEAMVENRIDPSFSLEIAQFNSKRISVGGAVGSPAIVPITLTPLFLDEALIRSGGVTTTDVDFASIRIYRDGTLYQIPLAEYLAQPRFQKTRLVAGDSVFVDTDFELEKARAFFEEQITLAQFRRQGRLQALSELTAEINLRRGALTETRSNLEQLVALDAIDRDYVYLTGEVGNPGRFVLPFGRQATLADALYADGGFSTETGDPAQVYVLRAASGDLDTITALHLDASKVSNLIFATRLNMRPNDIVFIAEQPVTRWNRVVSQIVPSLITTGVGIAAQ
jgi:polysaccharide export outer membrane protein